MSTETWADHLSSQVQRTVMGQQDSHLKVIRVRYIIENKCILCAGVSHCVKDSR